MSSGFTIFVNVYALFECHSVRSLNDLTTTFTFFIFFKFLVKFQNSGEKKVNENSGKSDYNQLLPKMKNPVNQ